MTQTDRMQRQGDRIIIESRVDMPDWEVRAYRRTRILIEGQPYYVSHRAKRGRWWCYTLLPWPEDNRDLPGRLVHYDDVYRASRDNVLRQRIHARIGYLLLWTVLPLIGFLWSRPKAFLAQQYSVDPVRATELSLYLSYSIVVVCMAFSLIGLVTGALPLKLLIPPILVLGVDALMRWDRVQRDQPMIGFYEWLLVRA